MVPPQLNTGLGFINQGLILLSHPSTNLTYIKIYGCLNVFNYIYGYLCGETKGIHLFFNWDILIYWDLWMDFWTLMDLSGYFPTCQVRVVRFYVS